VGVDQKGEEKNQLLEHELDKEFNSPIALNVPKRNRLHYAGHIIRRPEDLSQKTLFRATPMEGEIKEDRYPGGRMG
jgi:hypothetical protein